MKRLAVLGSTGSIGVSTLDVVESCRDAFRVVALAAGRNLDLLERQALRHEPELVAVADEAAGREMDRRLGRACRVVWGIDGLVEAALHAAAEQVVCGLVGAMGVRPTYAALDAGKSVALANKEALVVGGEFMTARARETGAVILPVDSEHNALHQCLRGETISEVRRLWLTASGGPFRNRPLDAMASITPEQALLHPTWSMGRKITIDSATLMNKGLEVIEAHWLFGIEPSRIRVVIHPKSVVHSMVEFVDGSFKAQLGIADMRHPIQYALAWPRRLPSALPAFDPVAAGPLEFGEPDVDRFPCLDLARRALEQGGAAPAALNAANEVAVQAFLERKIGFMDIPALVGRALDRHAGDPAACLEEVLAADARARQTVSRAIFQGVSS